jgi:hypothetical protein
LRNFSDQKDVICCVLLLLLKLLLWKKSSTEYVSIDEKIGSIQVHFNFVTVHATSPSHSFLFHFLSICCIQPVLSQTHFTLVGGVVSLKFVMVICDIARFSGDWEVSQLALALLAILIARDLTHSIANLLCKETDILKFFITTALSQERLAKKKVGWQTSSKTRFFVKHAVYLLWLIVSRWRSKSRTQLVQCGCIHYSPS